MQLQITDFGVNTLVAHAGPVPLEMFRLGSAFNYVPVPTDTNLHGSQVYSGDMSPGVAINANVVRYSCYLDYDVGNFDFGEIAFMYQGQLFALGVDSKLISKIRNGLGVGNSIRIDAYLSMVGDNYGMWIDVAETRNDFKMASLASPDMLPPSAVATPNAYIISGADSNQAAYIAYTDRNGHWNFDAYQFATAERATIVGFDNKSVTIALDEYTPSMTPSYFGEVVLEFITGDLYSICRYVKTTIASGSEITLGFETPLAKLPDVGDKIVIFRRAMGAPSLPIATTTTLGVIKVGSGLAITPDGTLSADGSALVQSVNGKTGIVILTADDIEGISTVGKTGHWNDLVGKPDLTLPTMSKTVKGGARLPANNNLVITGADVLDLGFTPVKTLNNLVPDANGNVNLTDLVVGLVNPTVISASANLNTYTTTGLFTADAGVVASLQNAPAFAGTSFVLEVLPPVGGNTIQRANNGVLTYWRSGNGGSWTSWALAATNSIATTNTLGIVKIGEGLAIDGTGNLTPMIATTDATGVIQVGEGLSINGSGLLSLDAPIASDTQRGLMQVGSGLQVDENGLVSVSSADLPIATVSSLGVIKVGTGLSVTEDGTLSATVASLPLATTSTVGVVKVGPGLSVAPDGTLSVSTSSLPIAKTTTTGVMSVGAGLSVTAAGKVSANLRTINGQFPDVNGNIAVAAPSDSNKLNRVNGIAVGIQLDFEDLGTQGAGPITVTATTANVQAATFTGGNVTWTFNGWPPAGTYAEVQMEIINGGLANHTFSNNVWWINPDGTHVNSFFAYISNQRPGAGNFQTTGTDFAIFWTRNAGAKVYAKLL